jgi:hypothetical protein
MGDINAVLSAEGKKMCRHSSLKFLLLPSATLAGVRVTLTTSKQLFLFGSRNHGWQLGWLCCGAQEIGICAHSSKGKKGGKAAATGWLPG